MKKYKKKEMIIVLILTCLLFSCGPRVKNGFVKEGENTYYYVNDKMQKGWREINEGWYFFFQGSGIMAKDTMIVDVDGKEYAFDDNGKMFKNKLTRVDVVRHRLDEKGRDVSRDNCNQVAYFGEDGAMLKSNDDNIMKVKIYNEAYYVDKNGQVMDEYEYEIIIKNKFANKYKSKYAIEYANFEYDIDKLFRDGNLLDAKTKLEQYKRVVDRNEYDMIDNITMSNLSKYEDIVNDDNKAIQFIKEYKQKLK